MHKLLNDLGAEAFAEYRKVGGILSREGFDQAALIMHATLFDAYIYGDGSREEAWAQFVSDLRPLTMDAAHAEAGRVFNAIDSVAPYS